MLQRLRVGTLAVCLSLVMGLATSAFAQNSLTIGNETALGLNDATIPVTMTNDEAVEGFVLAIGYDTMSISVSDASINGTVTDTAGAELVEVEIFEAQGGFTVGVVLDFQAPFDGQTIPAGAGQLIAEFTASADIMVGAPTIVDLTFEDGTFNTPPLDNILVINGSSQGAGQGLGLVNGSLTLEVAPDDELVIQDASGPGDESISVSVLLTNNSGGAQGFVLAIQHDDAVVNLINININGTATDAAGAEFVIPDENPAGGVGGTLGVVLDFEPPFDGQEIPMGSNQPIASFVYQCKEVVQVPEGDPVPAPVCGDLTFVNGVLGTPALDNIIVVNGVSIAPALTNGEVCCEAIVIPTVDTMFACGGLGEDGGLTTPVAQVGSTSEICFFYKDPTDNIQGFQLALTFDCNLCFVQGTFSLEGSILEAVGAEFVSTSVDNDPNDGDGCEFTLGILLDALPPFERQSAPSSDEFLLLGCIDVEVKDTAPCNTDLPITFTNGVNAGELVPIENIAVIDNQSVQGIQTMDCVISIVAEKIFVRGDCNVDSKVDLADAASILAQQFLGFDATCLDACDANDDGKINLADAVYLLNFLFDSGTPPPPPGADLDPGPDPTEDLLGCESGLDTCNP